MKSRRIAMAVTFLLANVRLISVIGGQRVAGTSEQGAEDAFMAGRFANAEKLYGQIAAADAKNYEASVRLGEIALLSNGGDVLPSG